MAQDQVQEVKSKTDIVSLISEYVDLKKAGRNYKAPCPFHSEKDPSFIVSPELQRYKCFGCGVTGDAYTFLEEFEGMDFGESLKYLADKAGVKLKPFKGNVRTDKERLIDINTLVAKFYHYVLLKHPVGKPALEYFIRDRGITRKTITEFGLGFSPRDSSIFTKFLMQKKKIDSRDLDKLGLIYSRAGKTIDRFNGRVVFPLSDHRGNVVGFAGRILPRWESKKIGKYINSPETPLYHKSSLLYGLDKTRADIKKTKEAVLVEGELDMLSVWQAGIQNCVAIKGTAVTKEQANLLRRFTDKITLSLDADLAGDNAARRGITIAEKVGLEIKVARLGDYKDPDEAVRKNPSEFRKILKNAVPVWDFLIDSTVSKYGSKSGSAKSRVSKEIIPVLAAINDSIVQAHYVGTVSKKLDVPAEAVSKQLEAYKSKETAETSRVEAVAKPEPVSGRQLREKRLLAIAFNHDPNKYLKPEVVELLFDPFTKKIIKHYEKYQREHKNENFDLAKFALELPNELQEGFGTMILSDVDQAGQSVVSIDKEFAMLEKRLKITTIEERLVVLAKVIEKYEQARQHSKVRAAQKEEKKLNEQLDSLRKS